MTIEGREDWSTSGATEGSESWRQELPSERRTSELEARLLGVTSLEDRADESSLEQCAHCGKPRSRGDLECRYCGAGFWEAAAAPDIIPKNIAEIFRFAWAMFSQNAGLCVFASLVDVMCTLIGAVLVLAPAVILLMFLQQNPLVGMPAFFTLLGLGAIFIYASICLGHAQFYFQLASGEQPEVFSILHISPHLRPMLVATLIYFGGVAIGIMMFVLPGIFLAIMWGMYPFVLVHRNVGALEALGEAWRLSTRNWTLVVPMTVVSFVVLQFANLIPGAFLLVIPFMALLQTYLYLHLSHHRSPQPR